MADCAAIVRQHPHSPGPAIRARYDWTGWPHLEPDHSQWPADIEEDLHPAKAIEGVNKRLERAGLPTYSELVALLRASQASDPAIAASADQALNEIDRHVPMI